MKTEAKKLVKEFKAFLSNADEEDFFITGAPKAPVTSVTPKPAPQPAVMPAPEITPQIKTQDIPPQTEAAIPMPKKKSANTNKDQILNEIAKTILACKKCPLGSTRLNAVPGEGTPNAKLMFIGEGPGFDEDHQGRPFIGRAGTLLTKMIEAMGLKREDVFIANMVKCHPMTDPSNPEKHGNDRAPVPSEIAVCRKYIEAQINAIRPDFIVALGGVAAKSLIADATSLGALRNKTHDLHFEGLEAPVKIIATYHPAALLRNPAWKKDAWADLQTVMNEMGLKQV